ncbi:MAG: 2-octaprenyl-6-methoxyphenyl hydroxylase [Halioglobus sp.]|mgnify:CR=1 FL=1|nr:2-octaprenyl-6-methoxyphenyl hydroxylase [Halioglobus sp.]
MSERRDIVIAGGGMVGISLALELSRVLPPEISILLVEGFALPAGGGDYHPSFDARSTALSYSSRLVYEQMQVWDELQQWLCPIEQIHVSSRGRFGSTLLRAADHGWPALGYVVENAWLGSVLASALARNPRVEVCSPARVVAARAAAAGLSLELEGEGAQPLQAGLLLVADGARSSLCRQLGVAHSDKPYAQHALVANIVSARPHAGCAFERFTDEGPLALLPLVPAAAAQQRSALVWTLPPERAASLVDCPQQMFLAELQRRFGYRLGRLRQVGERSVYPLSLVQAAEQVRQGVVVMGNAAHALHPVAGQGFNLALRDVVELARVLAAGVAAGRAPGDLGVLQQYRERQRADQQRTIGFSDRVPALFMHNDPVLGLGRDLALAGLDIAPPLKQAFVRHAAGMAALRGHGHG